MANGDTVELPLPYWAKIIGTVGIPAAIALFLVYSLDTKLDTAVRTANTNINKLQENLSLHATDMAYQIKMQEGIVRVLQQICANTATDNRQRALCFGSNQ